MTAPSESLRRPWIRPRRLRRSEAMRELVAETRLHAARLVLPIFVVEGAGVERPIGALPGHTQMSADVSVGLARRAADLGVGGLILFGVPAAKDATGSAAWDPSGPVPRALTAIREALGDRLTLWADVCLCEYTDHGHCGPVIRGPDGAAIVDNDAALPALARAAVTYAEAGADIVAPSDMMDGRVAVIREALDDIGRTDVAICSYAVKYASAFYGPFREAAGSAPAFGDRSGYQMDPRNRREALREVALDLEEGADIVMVKPAGPYLDVVSDVASSVDVPVAAYQVSGEYAMLHAAAEKGWLDLDRAVNETVTGIHRAGADIVLTYAALDLAAALGGAR